MTPILISGPAVEPVSLPQARAWLRVEATGEDDLIAALLTSARLVVEACTRTLLISQTWRIVYDAWPSGKVLYVPLAPFRSLEALRVFDGGNVASAIAVETYFLDPSPAAARISFLTSPPPPGRPVAGIELEMTAGYGASPHDVPEPLRQAIKMLAARWFENRGDAAADSQKLPAEIAALIEPFRRLRLA